MTVQVKVQEKWSILIKPESVLLGDNPFFGVDHFSQERARKKASISQDFDNAVDVIKYCYDAGVRGMVVNTHPNLKDLLGHLGRKYNLSDKINFYPILPGFSEYFSMITQKGIINSINEILSPAGLGNKIKILTKGGLGIVRKDLFEIFKVIIDVDMLQLQNTNVKTVFLHEIITDLALSFDSKILLEVFKEHLSDKYNVKAGLVTKNFPRLVDKLNAWNLEIPEIMTSFNKVGFQMNPTREDCENALARYKGDVTAMSVLAAGYLKPREAYEYVKSQPGLSKCVIGVSTLDHAKETFDLFLHI